MSHEHGLIDFQPTYFHLNIVETKNRPSSLSHDHLFCGWVCLIFSISSIGIRINLIEVNNWKTKYITPSSKLQNKSENHRISGKIDTSNTHTLSPIYLAWYINFNKTTETETKWIPLSLLQYRPPIWLDT
jgi:hypothetical protein